MIRVDKNIHVEVISRRVGPASITSGHQKGVTNDREVGYSECGMQGMLERLVESFPGLAYRCKHDADWTLEFSSAGSMTLLGYTPHELVVDRVVAIADLIHADDLSGVSLEVERALAERRPFRMQYRMRTKDGREKWISEIGHGVIAEDGSLIALEGFLTDITEQVRAQHAVFEDSRKETVTRFASGIAHDLNNMLTGLNAIIELIGHHTAPGDVVREELSSLQLLGQSITSLAKQLSSLGAGAAGVRGPVDLRQLVASLAPMLRRLVGGTIVVEVDAEPGVIVRADPSRLEQALINLVINARDAIDGAGKIEIAARTVGNLASLSVADDGAGIDEQLQPKIFDAFFTTKSRDRGTGLGLMVVEQVAKEIGAQIKLDSALGRGSRFELLIPIEDGAAVSQRDDEMGSEVVLLVDDDALLRATLARGLRRLGYTVLESADGELALRLSERHRGTIDVLVTDGKMPRVSGPELARAFREHRASTRRVLITGDNIAALPQLFDARLQKPFTPNELASVLRRVMSQAPASSTPTESPADTNDLKK